MVELDVFIEWTRGIAPWVFDVVMCTGQSVRTQASVGVNFPSNPVHNRPAGGPLWKLDKDLKLRADLTQNDTISPCRVLDQVASMGFQLFACPECEYQNVYVFVRREGGL